MPRLPLSKTCSCVGSSEPSNRILGERKRRATRRARALDRLSVDNFAIRKCDSLKKIDVNIFSLVPLISMMHRKTNTNTLSINRALCTYCKTLDFKEILSE